MKILIAGASGFIGTALTKYLKEKGHEIFKLVRNAPKEKNQIFWDPQKGILNANDIEGFDAVINLSGENIFAFRWTKEKKKRILDSRVNSTKTLVDALISLKNPPNVLINASAIGIYGTRNHEIISEDSPLGAGFLAYVCKEWEEATQPAVDKGIRVVISRTGIVLSKEDGPLYKMLLPFKLGLGGTIGSGQQYMSWIALEDLLEVIHFALLSDKVSGPINAVTPHPVTNEEFTKTLGQVLHRPTLFPVPNLVLKGIFGEMAEETFLSSVNAQPKRLLEAEYQFKYPSLEDYLRFELG